MAAPDTDNFKLSVLSPAGRDPEQYFDEPVAPDSRGHAPVNFHAFAACTGGAFHRDVRAAIAEKRPILLLLRANFKATQRALTECKRARRTVVVSLKETGLHQIADQMQDGDRIARFLDIVTRADGCLATTPEAADLYRQVRGNTDKTRIGFIPTPYPLDDSKWNFSVPPDKQRGIFIGTREWDIPSRNHFAALLLARKICEATGEKVTVFNLDGRRGMKRLAGLNFPAGKLHVIQGRKPYAEYLREMGKHKIVLQMDRSGVPGQVAGDALLCRTVCVGGDGVTERIAFPNSCGNGRAFDQIISIATALVKDTSARATAVMESQWRGLERLSFQAGRTQLRNFFDQLGKTIPDAVITRMEPKKPGPQPAPLKQGEPAPAAPAAAQNMQVADLLAALQAGFVKEEQKPAGKPAAEAKTAPPPGESKKNPAESSAPKPGK